MLAQNELCDLFSQIDPGEVIPFVVVDVATVVVVVVAVSGPEQLLHVLAHLL